MIIICSWCPKGSPTKDMGTKEPLEDESETSSICDECLATMDAQIDNLKKRKEGQHEG